MTLFDPGPETYTDPARTVTRPTAGGKRRTDYTAIARNMLAAGRHPATCVAVREPRDRTCGDCVHAVNMNGYWKCERHRLGLSASEASDIRISWPACDRFVEHLEGPA